jgi:hypothetical protein
LRPTTISIFHDSYMLRQRSFTNICYDLLHASFAYFLIAYGVFFS